MIAMITPLLLITLLVNLGFVLGYLYLKVLLQDLLLGLFRQGACYRLTIGSIITFINCNV